MRSMIGIIALAVTTSCASRSALKPASAEPIPELPRPQVSILGSAVPAFRPFIKQETLVLTELAKHNLDFLFSAIADGANLEAWFCMTNQKLLPVLERLTPVWIDSADGGHLYGDPVLSCDPAVTIGTIHFHPGVGYCQFSNVDVVSAHALPYSLMAIVCKERKGGPLKVVVMDRNEITAKWQKLLGPGGKLIGGAGEFRFTPTYRYHEWP